MLARRLPEPRICVELCRGSVRLEGSVAPRGGAPGLSEQALMFWAALATDDSAVTVLGDDTRCAIPRELVKRILRCSGCAPDKLEQAAQTVLGQARCRPPPHPQGGAGLSEQALMFWAALATDDSAVTVLGDDTRCAIPRELVKRILRRSGCAPDKQEQATQTVLGQARCRPPPHPQGGAGWSDPAAIRRPRVRLAVSAPTASQNDHLPRGARSTSDH